MDKKRVIGVKSYKFILLESISFVVCLFFSALLLCDYIKSKRIVCLIFGLLMSICLIFILYLLINAVSRPKNIIEADAKGVYLNYNKSKTVYILFKDIDNTFSNKVSAMHGKIYLFGNLEIKTKDKTYKIGIIDNVDEVSKYIYSKIAWKFKY